MTDVSPPDPGCWVVEGGGDSAPVVAVMVVVVIVVLLVVVEELSVVPVSASGEAASAP